MGIIMAIDRFYDNFVAENGLIQIWRRTTIKSDYTLSSSTTGLINTSTQAESRQAQQQNVNMTHKMYCPVTVDVNKHDQVRLDLGGGDFIKYRVEGDPKNTISRNHHFKLILKKLGVDNNG